MAKAPTDDRLTGGTISNGKPVLRDRFMIDPASPIPELDLPNAAAYAVTDRRDAARQLYALVCKPELTPRIEEMRKLRGSSAPGLLSLIEWGVVEWPPFDRRTIAVIYQLPMGGKFMRGLSETRTPIDPMDAKEKIVAPLYSGLRELAARNVVHRAIRPDNIYYLDEGRTQVVLGDCTTAPPAFDQHALFEPVSSGATPPIARGRGDFRNDMYSLGATLMFMIAGRNPASTLDENALIDQKIADSSFKVLVGETSLGDTMLELLRGLLSDEAKDRWNLEKLDLWLSGRRLTPGQMTRARRAKQPFEFAGKKYSQKRSLARAISQNWAAGLKIAREGVIEVWLRHALEDKDTSERIGAAVRDATADEASSGQDDDTLLARICMALDPYGPIRFRNITAMPEGLGWLIENDQSAGQNFADLIRKDMVRYWAESQPEYLPEHTILVETAKNIEKFVRQPGMGSGIERCIYELMPVAPCRSPLIERDYVLDIAEILPALDRASKRVDKSVMPVDRHIAAFVKSRFDQNVDKQIEALMDGNKERATLGMLSLLAMLQWRLGPETVFGLASWIGGIAQPAINSYHSRTQRKNLEREIPKMVRRGSLPDIYNLIENSENRQTDDRGYENAIEEFRQAQAEATEIETGEDRRKIEARLYGQQTAAIISLLIGMTALVMLSAGRMF
ncbi:MAG: protein kinase family protein [Rhodospirillales bacterium]